MATWLTSTASGVVVELDDESAVDATRVGAKAANLASARRAGLPTLGGFVLPIATAARVAASGKLDGAVLAAYLEHSDQGRGPVVVRSSSPSEDSATSSMAGHFESVVGVAGREAFADAVAAVVASAGEGPMAVLVQPHLDPRVSGIAFGVDPVSGRSDRRVVVAVAGGPQALVGGAVTGDRYELDGRGRLRSRRMGDGGTDLDRAERRAVARLVARAASAFGGPQDIEWAFAVDGTLLLLQSRPVTVTGERAAGPIYAPGPLAETFPAPLSPLEQDLWLPPLRDAIREVAVLTGRTSRRHVATRPIVVSPGGRPAVDAELLGPPPTGFTAALDPRPRLRRLRAATRVGRLGAALPAIIGRLVGETDAALGAVPALDEVDDATLLDILDRTADALRSLHGHELLAGVLAGEAGGAGAAEVALRALQRGHLDELSDDAVRSAYPEVLVLSAPRIAPPTRLPLVAPAVRAVTVEELAPREALRLRIRWTHELAVRAALELGTRLVARGLLADPSQIRGFRLASMSRLVAGQPVAPDSVEEGAPLPDRFRLTPSGQVVAASSSTPAEGIGAGGGRRSGPVHLGDEPPPGSVLVVDVLDPKLAVHLPRLAGVVAETGSPLSHLAILAREHGVATVVGFPGARQRWQPGQVVIVDGTSGSVQVGDEAPAVAW